MYNKNDLQIRIGTTEYQLYTELIFAKTAKDCNQQQHEGNDLLLRT